MFEVQLFAPLAANDGTPFGSEDFAAFEAKAIELLGGFSLYPSHVVGGWRDDAGQDIRDASRVYAVALSTIGQGSALVELALYAKAAFKQDAIFIRYLGEAEIL